MTNLPSRYGPEFPGDFFQAHELNGRAGVALPTPDQLWDILTEEQAVGITDWDSTTQIRRLTAPGRLFFRGQANGGHGLSSSLHRLIAEESDRPLTEALLGQVESAIIDEAAGHGLLKEISRGELLMILQHHSAPTRLLDVSLKPLEALYFAVEKLDAQDGRLFIVWLNGQPDLALRGTDELPWTGYVRPGGQAAAEWTQSVRLIDEQPLDPRMVAQQGRFLVGGVQRAYANLNMWHTRQLRVSERQKISMLCIGFFSSPQSSMRNTQWPALGWTIRIPSAWKADLRGRLATEGITHDSMYPDLASIEWRAQRAARNSLSKLRAESP
jgi:hypothetical protein